jgi:hypothetical protein
MLLAPVSRQFSRLQELVNLFSCLVTEPQRDLSRPQRSISILQQICSARIAVAGTSRPQYPHSIGARVLATDAGFQPMSYWHRPYSMKDKPPTFFFMRQPDS